MTSATLSAILSGLVLILWSLVTYFVSESRSPTAFIPAAFGALMLVFGLIGRNEGKRKHAMHGVALVALLGLLGGFGMGLRKVFSDPNLAAYSQIFLGAVSLVLLVICVRSFIAARRA